MTKQITARQVEVAERFFAALDGDIRSQNWLVEGISTSDIPVQLTPTLERLALEQYEAASNVWRQFAGIEEVQDFESSPYYSFQWSDEDVEDSNGGTDFTSGGLARIPEYDEYPVLRFSATEQSLKTAKNGVQIKYSWESLVRSRNFSLLRRTFEEFGKRAAYTEEVEATKPLLSNVNFSVANGNVFTGNPALTLPNLEAAFQFIAGQTYNGNPVRPASRYRLVVGPALELTAAQIKSITQVDRIETVGSVETRYQSGNPVAGKFDVVVSEALVDLGAPANAWWLVPVPGSTPNPSVVNVFLQGERGPKVFVKRTTNSAPEEGDFLDDSYSTKVRHVVAGGFIRPEATLYSSGAGS